MANNIDRPNRATPDQTRDYIRRIENLLGDKRSAHGTYMKEAQQIQGDINEIYDEAKGAGIPKKALKLEIDRRESEQKFAKKLALLDDDQRAVFDDIRQLSEEAGDAPAKAKEKPARQNAAAADALMSAAADTAEAEKAKASEKDAIEAQRKRDSEEFDAKAAAKAKAKAEARAELLKKDDVKAAEKPASAVADNTPKISASAARGRRTAMSPAQAKEEAKRKADSYFNKGGETKGKTLAETGNAF